MSHALMLHYVAVQGHAIEIVWNFHYCISNQEIIPRVKKWKRKTGKEVLIISLVPFRFVPYMK